MRKALAVLVALAVIGVGAYTFSQNTTSDTASRQASDAARQRGFDKKQHSTSEAASIWLVVNKQRPLTPKEYKPQPLVLPGIPRRLADSSPEMLMRKDAAQALEAMNADAQKDGAGLLLASGHRSYGYQNGLYRHYVNTQGQAEADTQSARPGHSEHQTGLAADVVGTSRTCEVMQCFEETPEGQWIAKNAYKYGFVIRYPKGKQATTGYIYEPWHLRYVGKALAAELHKQGNPTLEEYFGLGNAPDYK